MEVQVVNQPSAVVEAAISSMANSIETTFMPVVAAMNKKIDLDLNILRRVDELGAGLDEFKRLARDSDDAQNT